MVCQGSELPQPEAPICRFAADMICAWLPGWEGLILPCVTLWSVAVAAAVTSTYRVIAVAQPYQQETLKFLLKEAIFNLLKKASLMRQLQSSSGNSCQQGAQDKDTRNLRSRSQLLDILQECGALLSESALSVQL